MKWMDLIAVGQPKTNAQEKPALYTDNLALVELD